MTHSRSPVDVFFFLLTFLYFRLYCFLFSNFQVLEVGSVGDLANCKLSSLLIAGRRLQDVAASNSRIIHLHYFCTETKLILSSWRVLLFIGTMRSMTTRLPIYINSLYTIHPKESKKNKQIQPTAKVTFRSCLCRPIEHP